MKKIGLIGLLILFATTAFSSPINFPQCCIICKVGKACGNSCIPNDVLCEIPIDWGCACDYRYVRIFEANKALCCFRNGGAIGCAGDRMLCYDGTISDRCGCKFLLEGEESQINPTKLMSIEDKRNDYRY